MHICTRYCKAEMHIVCTTSCKQGTFCLKISSLQRAIASLNNNCTKMPSNIHYVIAAADEVSFAFGRSTPSTRWRDRVKAAAGAVTPLPAFLLPPDIRFGNRGSTDEDVNVTVAVSSKGIISLVWQASKFVINQAANGNSRIFLKAS